MMAAGISTVEYLHPSSDSEKQTYTSITTLGGPFGALTTHNESGITLTLHQLLVDQVSLKGRPILSLTEEISSRARTIDEALAILRANRTSSTWRLILTSLEENRSVNVDLSPLGVFVTPLEKLGNAVTNTAINPAMQKDEFALDFSFYADTRYRHMVLGTRLKNFSAATVQDAIDLISSHESFDVYQKSWKDKSPRNTIGKRSNVQSLVLAPSDGLVYVAVPPMPFARPLEGSYIPLPISSKEWRANPDYLSLPSLKRRKAFNRDFVEANAYFRKAVIPLTEEGRFEEGIRLIEEAAKLQPDEAAYPLTAAWTEFLVYWRSEDPKVRDEALERAYEFLNRAEDLELENYHENLIWLFKARYFDLKNDREAAKKYLFRVKRDISKQLAEAADRQEKFGYSRSQLRSMVIDYLNVDLHQF
ncbi:MAG: hypothetical protein J0L93_10440 [Deltaproteobacteria bacterium]|nr:hypothetical protein [Deltaproteobacteria bacterium]